MKEMCRHLISAFIFGIVASWCGMDAKALNQVVADSVTHAPLPSASVFDRRGNAIGISNSNGRLPFIAESCYPITVRYLGFMEKVVPAAGSDTIFLRDNMAQLPEVTVESSRHKVLHMLAYVREYSTMTTYTDTVFLFREKMVDYMLTPDPKVSFRGWSTPRIMACRSYYRFTNSEGLDSVGDVSNHHFSWSDWVGVAPSAEIPKILGGLDCGSDTLQGKYSPAEIWTKNASRVTVDVDILADKKERRWVPDFRGFFRKDLEFDNFRIRISYDNVAGDSVTPMDITGYTFNIESNGRGHEMFRFNRVNEPFFVSTYGEVYMTDKEYITVKEARKWEKYNFNTNKTDIYEPMEAPPLQPSIQLLVDRVNNVDREGVRLAITPDSRLIGRGVVRQNFGDRVLGLLKTITGIRRYKMNRNMNRQWKEFRKEQVRKNNRAGADGKDKDDNRK